jgi:hypothetical protein
VLANTGVPKVGFYDLRYTTVSFILNHGIPAIVVLRIISQSKPGIPQDIDCHILSEMQGEIAHLIDGLVSPVKGGLSSNMRIKTI